MKPICPRVGHLVRVREDSVLERELDLGLRFNDVTRAWRGCGLVVATRGIEVQVFLSGTIFSWVRRDNVEVVDESR